MEYKLTEYLNNHNILNFTSIVQALFFGILIYFSYLIGAKLISTIDDRVFKKRFSSHRTTPWLKIALPILFIFFFLVINYSSDLFVNLMLIVLFAALTSYFLFKMIVSIVFYVPLILKMGMKEGAVLEFRGQVGHIKKIGLFYVELSENEKTHIIPTWILLKSDFYLSQNLNTHQTSFSADLLKELNKDRLKLIKRVLQAKSYVDKNSIVEVRLEGKKIFFNFKVSKTNLLPYAKLDFAKTIQQMNQ